MSVLQLCRYVQCERAKFPASIAGPLQATSPDEEPADGHYHQDPQQRAKDRGTATEQQVQAGHY